jgi:TrmH family RNA methyltransferase
MITSSQNAKIKLIRQLQGRAKDRREAGAFLAEGVRLIEEALHAKWNFRFVLYSDELSERGKSLRSQLSTFQIETEQVDANTFAAISETESSQGIIAVLDHSPLPIPQSPNFILIPDQVRDPGNLGALIRSAAAANIQAVLIPPETTDAFAPKVIRAGMGAHFRLPIHAMTWEEINNVCTLERLNVLLADMQGRSCWNVDLRDPLALIVGGEAKGASKAARSLAAETISIPMPGNMESLNAGAAGSILMFEVVRQRLGV